jgi:hypothetical protein
MIFTVNFNGLQVPADRFVNLFFIIVRKSKLIAKPVLFNFIKSTLFKYVLFTHF